MIANTEREFYRVDEVANILGVDETEVIRLVIDEKLRLSAEVVGLLHYEYSSPCDDAPPYDDKERINGEWFKFSETLRATSNQVLDIVKSYQLDEELKVLWSKAGSHKFFSLEGDVFDLILALEDGSYIRPITHDGDEWSHYVNIPNDIILGVKRENLDAFMAEARTLKGAFGNEQERCINQLIKFKNFLTVQEACNLAGEYLGRAERKTLYELALQGVLPLSLNMGNQTLDFWLGDEACKKYMESLVYYDPITLGLGAFGSVEIGQNLASPPDENKAFRFKDPESEELISFPKFPNGVIGFRSEPLYTLIGIKISSEKSDETPKEVYGGKVGKNKARAHYMDSPINRARDIAKDKNGLDEIWSILVENAMGDSPWPPITDVKSIPKDVKGKTFFEIRIISYENEFTKIALRDYLKSRQI